MNVYSRGGQRTHSKSPKKRPFYAKSRHKKKKESYIKKKSLLLAPVNFIDKAFAQSVRSLIASPYERNKDVVRCAS